MRADSVCEREWSSRECMQVWGGNRGGVRGSSFAPEKGIVTVRAAMAMAMDRGHETWLPGQAEIRLKDSKSDWEQNFKSHHRSVQGQKTSPARPRTGAPGV